MLFGVHVSISCRILYSFVSIYMYVSCSGSITSVGEERSNVSAIFFMYVSKWFLFEEVSFSS